MNENALGEKNESNNEKNLAGDFLYCLHSQEIKQILFYPKNIGCMLETLPQVSFAEILKYQIKLRTR